MKSVWILGLGYLGAPLANMLLAEGYRVVGSSRHVKSTPELSHVQQIPLDIANIHTVSDFPKILAADTWICLLPPSCAENYVDFLNIWLQAALVLGVRNIVYCSSTAVYGNETRSCFAHTATQPETKSALKMVAVEQSLLASHIENVSIVRLGGLFSDTRHPIRMLSQRGIVNEAQQQVNMISQAQAVQFLKQCVIEQQGHCIHNAVMDTHPSKREFYSQAAKQLGFSHPKFVDGQQGLGKCVEQGTHVLTTKVTT